jgi:uncharacterized membrane protein
MPGTLTGKEKYRTYTDDIESNRVRQGGTASGMNVSEPERWVSTIGGGALTAYGLSRRSWTSAILALMGSALVYRGVTGHCSVYGALGANTRAIGRRKVNTDRAAKVENSVTINRPAEELYRFWRDLTNLPRFMKHVESVLVKDNRHSHWVVKAPLGMTVEWDAEIISEIPNELIGWRSVGSGDVDHAGSVRFEPAGSRGTTVKVMLQYDPPAGPVGVAFANILGEDPGHQIEEDLQRFKEVMETAKPSATASQTSGHESLKTI